MDGEDLKQWCINLLFLKHMQLRSIFVQARRRDESLPKDKAEAASSSWLYGKEAWWRRPEEGRHRGGERTVTRIVLGQKIKKIHTIDLVATNGQWRFKATVS
jgi:hypothetical protein